MHLTFALEYPHTSNMYSRLLGIILCCLIAVPAYPWGDEGHRITARIAARNLTPAARAKIVEILRSVTTANDDLKLLKIVGGKNKPQPSQRTWRRL